ncbi:hypothetical protein AAVH_32631 [Aphelenchoides avenae]|nr:hypothetical protein AAVH_32631 [Aphelenchus avenae]
MTVCHLVGRYPYVVLGLKNTAWVENGGEASVYNFMWTDGSFFDYSMLRAGEFGYYDKCAFFQKAKADEWTTMDCLKPDYMATAICQKGPKVA